MSIFKDPTLNAMADAVDHPKKIQGEGTGGQESQNPAFETAFCLVCGMEEDADALQDGLCYVCRAYPEGSYEWHLAICFKGGDPSSDEADAFRSGWLRGVSEAERRIKEMTGVEIDLQLDPQPGHHRA